MQKEAGEWDYRAGAVPEVDPETFPERVRQAYRLEHNCRFDNEIALVLRAEKSWVSQLFKNPGELDARAVEGVLAPLRSAEHKRRILAAWVEARFGIDPTTPLPDSLIGDDVTERIVRRIDRQVREGRLRLAARVAGEAARKTSDPTMRERLLDRVYFAHQRLDEPGQAMAVARAIALGAQRRGEARRLAAAHLFRARVLLGLPDSKPGEVEPAISAAKAFIVGQPPVPSPAPPYVLATERRVRMLELGARVTFMERRLVERDETLLRATLAEVLAASKATKAYQERHRCYQLAARTHLLLGETFQAQEALERSFESGGLKNLHTFEASGLVQGRIVLETDGPERAIEYLREVRDNCVRSSDWYHGRLVEYDLARLESGLFPLAG
jgi:hypothetical protein